MSKVPMSGKAQTVLGPINPEQIGATLAHEHLLIDFTPVLIRPTEASDIARMHEKVSLENLGWVRYHWASNIDNLLLLDEDLAIDEARRFANAGGGTVVDVTSIGIARDPLALTRISRATGLNVVMGAGYYIGSTHPDGFEDLPVEEIADTIIRDVEVGVGDTGIRAGMIGEIGCSWPWTDGEKKSVHAAVIAQRETGAPLNIHPGRNDRGPMEIVDALAEWGADLNRTVMSHISRTIFDRSILRELAATGVYLEYDLFGHDSSYYPFAPDTYMPGDHERIKQIEGLIDEGHLERILMSHDMCGKHRQRAYGGHGWDHILARVVPRMRALGFSEEHVAAMLVHNPARMLTFA